MAKDPLEDLAMGLEMLRQVEQRLSQTTRREDLARELERALALVELMVGKTVLTANLAWEDLVERHERGEMSYGQLSEMHTIFDQLKTHYRNLSHHYDQAKRML